MRRKKIKAVITYIILWCMLFNGVIFDTPKSYGAGEKKLTLTNVYEGFSRTEKRIEIEDPAMTDFQNKKVQIRIDEGWKSPKNTLIVGQTIIQAELEPIWDITDVMVQGTVSEGDPPQNKDKEIKYSGIHESGIPEILNVDKPIVKTNEAIVLNGKDNIKQLTGEDYKITVGGIEAEAKSVVGTNQVKLEPASGQQFPRGIRNIVVSKSETAGEGSNAYVLETSFIYKNAVRIVGELGIDGISMFPTMGEPNSRVTFSRKNFPNIDGYDIYFIKDLNDQKSFNQNNMMKNISITQSQDESKDSTITANVPQVNSGPYYVVFTNKDSLKNGIESMYVLPQKFQVVTISQKPTIDSIQPNRAPSMTPTTVQIEGNYFVNHNIPGFTPDNNGPTIADVDEGDKQVVIDYGSGKLEIPDESGTIKEYNVSVKRTIEVDIGRVLGFESGGFKAELGNSSDPNTFKIRTETFTLDQTQVEDAIVRVQTNITGEFNATMEQEVTVKDGFTYYPPSETPKVSEVVPNIIPIEEDSGGFYLDNTMERLLLSVEGSNFLVTRYTDPADGTEKINYPKVTIGGVIINPNDNRLASEYKPYKFEVLNNGKLVDGTLGNEIGNRILIELKAGSEGFKVENKDSRNVNIRNPIRQSSQHGVTDWIFEDKVKFELIDKNNFPVIESVTPSLVSIDGGENVVVKGSNFRPGAKVYIENKLVPGVTISGDTKTITFKAPKGSRAGETLLQIVNPEGGLASYAFTYTQTYTEPKLSYINPSSGTENTLVTVKGENFLAPDPTVVINNIDEVDEGLIYRLIGTRILMDNQDINQYNRGEQNRIKLTPFNGGNIFKYNDVENKIVLGEGYDSVILYNESTSKFFALRKDVKNDFSIEGGEGILYKITYNKNTGEFKANDYVITQEDGKISFNGLELQAYTPYLIRDGKIVGNNVRFIDSNTLTFKVPNLSNSPWTGEGYYNVTVVNPDTKKQTINKGFYYFAASATKPVIADVVPDTGPDSGGNIITLIGPSKDPSDPNDKNIGFSDIGSDKTKIFIGGQRVPAEDITISPDGREMKLKVPPTIENIKEKGTDRITVPIVAVNPDGGTFSISYENPLIVNDNGVEKIIRGYTYVVPTSHPKISEVVPKEGSTAGGYIVEIFGSDFRNFKIVKDEDGKEERISASTDKEKSRYNDSYERLTDPLYPKVYFGSKEADLVEFSSGYLQVVVPPNNSGSTDLYVVNNDAGISDKAQFNYLTSAISVSAIVPNVGIKNGGQKIDIHGSGFEVGKVSLVEKDNPDKITEKQLPLVVFGTRTNENIPRESENSGVIRSSRATVKLDGGLEVKYDAVNSTLDMKIEENKKVYSFTYNNYNGEKIFVNTNNFKTDEGVYYPHEELIKAEVKDNRLLAEGGYAPDGEYRNKTQISVTTPCYYTVGQVPVFVVNPDGAKGGGTFEYKNPNSVPAITNVTRDSRNPVEEYREEIGGNAKILKVNYNGGSVISVYGTDFREGAVIKVSNLLTIGEGNIDYSLPTKLSFVIPAVPETEVGKLYRVVVENKDGGVASSDTLNPPIFIEFTKGETNPAVNTITPDKGPATGGTKVEITGDDFRKTMEGYEGESIKVYFGEKEVDEGNIKFIDYQHLEVTAPSSEKLGNVSVRVENPDGSLTSGDTSFTYISKPTISTVSPNKIFTNDTDTEVTITGNMFQPGAKVIVGGKIVDKDDLTKEMEVTGEGIIGVDSTGKNREVYVVGGIPAASVAVEGDKVLKVKFQEAADLENTHLIIVNPDGGVSDPYDRFTYEKPIPLKPFVLEGIPGYESTVKLIWSKSDEDILNKATRYEIYGKEDGDAEYALVGDTTEAEFLVKGLKVNTSYTFMVRALNQYGGAIDFATVKVKTLTLHEDEKLKEKEEQLEKEKKELEEKGKEEISNGSLLRIVGSDEIRGGVGSIDLSLSKYKNLNKFTIAVPLSLARNDSQITIKDGTLNLMINPKAMYTLEVSKKDKGDEDSYVRINIVRANESHVPRNKKAASKSYDISFDFQYGKDILKINTLMKSGKINMNLNAAGYSNARNVYMAVLDKNTGQYVKNTESGSIKEEGKYILLCDR